MKDDFGVLVLSCDKYKELWDPFFKLFFLHWKDCNYAIYLGSNEIAYKNDKVIPVLSGPDKDWSTSFRKILSQIKENYVLVWLDDCFLNRDVDNDKIKEISNFMTTSRLKYLHALPIPYPDEIKNNYGIYHKGMPYRITVIGFWDKEYLLKLLIDGESPWNFEIMGSYRTKYDDGFYCLMNPPFEWLNVVEKGFLNPSIAKDLAEKNIYLDFETIRKMNYFQKLKADLLSIIFHTISKLHWTRRVKIMNVLRKILISY